MTAPTEAAAARDQGDRKGLLKTISKMGISTIPSYCGAQIFEAVGLEPRAGRAPLHRHASRIGGIGLDVLATRRSTATRAPTRPARRRCCRSAASTPGGARASTTSGTRRRSRCSSTRCVAKATWRRAGGDAQAEPSARAPACRSTTSTRGRQRGRRAQATLRGLLGSREGRQAIPLERGRAGRGDREALLHRRDVARLDLARGARDARDRDEPARRPLEHRRGRRGPGALHCPTPTATRAARRSSRSPRAASA